MCRTSRLQIFFKIGAVKDFLNFTGKHRRWSLFRSIRFMPMFLFSCLEITFVYKYILRNRVISPKISQNNVEDLKNVGIFPFMSRNDSFVCFYFFPDFIILPFVTSASLKTVFNDFR